MIDAYQLLNRSMIAEDIICLSAGASGQLGVPLR